MDTKEIRRRILRDIRVDAAQEFDRNFERQSFFGEAWRRRRSPLRGDGHLLVDSGALRRSVRSRSDDTSVTFFSTLPYAVIHNNGGEIVVTRRMRCFFWAMYRKAVGGFRRRRLPNLHFQKIS